VSVQYILNFLNPTAVMMVTILSWLTLLQLKPRTDVFKSIHPQLAKFISSNSQK